MPTLYDNLSQVRQFIDENNSSYVSKTELANASYVTSTALNNMGYITSIPNTYASYTGVYSYLNSLGISKGIDLETVRIDSAIISDSELVGDIYINDVSTNDLVTQEGLSANSYVTSNDISGKADKSDLRSYLSVSNWSTGNYDIQLRKTGLTLISTNHSIAPATIAYEYVDNSSYTNAWIGLNTLKNYTNGRLAEIEASYVTSADLPVINESIVPKETNTYTLGDATYLYKATYTSNLYAYRSYIGDINVFYNTPGGGMILQRNGTDVCAFLGGGNIGISPSSNKSASLGNPLQYWNKIYADTAYISNYNNFIWTGTSAEYAALDNYTTYQIYMIKEA